MSYDVVLYVVQRGTEIHHDFLKLKKVFEKEELKAEYNEFKLINKEYTFKDYSNKKLEFINKMLKKVEIDD